eukprot:TRINITY_DN10101_c0_g1_i1.p2 TRINITY_DN10101_c0_g1~~TRINITY_DN10101_c0_g1_i1.p2  ORF type:complete len:110 (+),score=42.48 TRINITY_DN10101_c0_g1_i1:35-364(+)
MFFSFGVWCVSHLFFFFFFKQKTAYEMLRSLVGSEMCIRDSGINAEYGVCCAVMAGFTDLLHTLVDVSMADMSVALHRTAAPPSPDTLRPEEQPRPAKRGRNDLSLIHI